MLNEVSFPFSVLNESSRGWEMKMKFAIVYIYGFIFARCAKIGCCNTSTSTILSVTSDGGPDSEVFLFVSADCLDVQIEACCFCLVLGFVCSH